MRILKQKIIRIPIIEEKQKSLPKLRIPLKEKKNPEIIKNEDENLKKKLLKFETEYNNLLNNYKIECKNNSNLNTLLKEKNQEISELKALLIVKDGRMKEFSKTNALEQGKANMIKNNFDELFKKKREIEFENENLLDELDGLKNKFDISNFENSIQNEELTRRLNNQVNY